MSVACCRPYPIGANDVNQILKTQYDFPGLEGQIQRMPFLEGLMQTRKVAERLALQVVELKDRVLEKGKDPSHEKNFQPLSNQFEHLQVIAGIARCVLEDLQEALKSFDQNAPLYHSPKFAAPQDVLDYQVATFRDTQMIVVEIEKILSELNTEFLTRGESSILLAGWISILGSGFSESQKQ